MASSDGTFPAAGGSVAASDTTQQLQNYWTRVLHEIKNLQPNDFKTQELPLARIKKIMKLDEDVKMISAEAPLVFSKACELFVKELTLRAWIHTEDNKRRTLQACEIFIRELTLRAWLHTEDNKRRTQQRNDIAMAISKFDQFDFLIDIVPRDELKPAKRPDEGTQRAGMMPDQVQYLLQLASQTQQQLQTSAPAATTQTPSQTQIIQLQTAGGQIIQQPVQIQSMATPQGGGDATQAQQVLQIQPQAAAQTQQAQVQQVQIQQPAQQQQQQQSQTTQVFQQIVTPSGEVQNVPIQLTQAQLMAIQQQMQGKQPGQQIIIQTQQPTTTQAETSTTSTVDQTQFSTAAQPLFQIQQTMPQQILVQPSADGSGDQTVDLTDVST